MDKGLGGRLRETVAGLTLVKIARMATSMLRLMYHLAVDAYPRPWVGG